jgi:hypothetical protein
MAAIDEKIEQVRLALLESILSKPHTPSNVLKFAEAYAWITNPSAPHGGPSSANE